MTTLKDPDRLAGADVEKLKDGTFRTKDGRILQPAAKNPWYVLMTIHGEQDGEEIDPARAKSNCTFWNSLARADLGSDEQQRLERDNNISLTDSPNTANFHGNAMQKLNSRLGDGARMPSSSDQVDFSNTVFEQTVLFPKAVFSRRVNFSGAVFLKPAMFSGAVFVEQADFSGARFEMDAGFTSTTFERTSQFSDVTFANEAAFGFATFSQEVMFKKAKFEQGAEFSKARFINYSSFQDAKVTKGANFTDATFGGPAIFYGMDLGAAVSFAHSQIGKAADFRSAYFRKEYPDLTGTDLPQSTQFSPDKALWPERPEDFDKAKETCSTIRHILGQQGRPEEEHFFFRKEMWFAGRIPGDALLARLPYLMFGWVSDFGYSIARPAWALICLWLIGFATFAGYLSACCTPAPAAPPKSPIFDAFGLSFSNVLPFFGTRSLFADDGSLREFPEVLIFLSGFQTVAGVLLLFFLGLGLRTRFRLR